MPARFPREMLEHRVALIEHQVASFQRLINLNILNGKVLNIGCTSEIEPVALMWVLNTNNVTGLNKNITQAEQSCSFLEELLHDAKEACKFVYTSEEDRLFWDNRIPDFLKKGILPNLVQEDLLERLQPRNHFDLVYSSGVLKHIDDVKSAIEEMGHIVKLGGWVITDGVQQGEFKQTFEQVGLEFSDNESDEQMEFYRKIKP